jgi:hypothetical protein
MAYFKRNDPFYTSVLPVKMHHNWQQRFWFVVDHNDVIIAEGLTKETASSIVTAMNYIDETLGLLKALYDHENVVVYRKDGDEKRAQDRDNLVKAQYEMLKEFGIEVKWIGAQDYHKNLWNCFHDIIETHQQQIRERPKGESILDDEDTLT